MVVVVVFLLLSLSPGLTGIDVSSSRVYMDRQNYRDFVQLLKLDDCLIGLVLITDAPVLVL